MDAAANAATRARDSSVSKRAPIVDPVYSSPLVSQLINKVLVSGKKQQAQRIVYTALEGCREKNGTDPLVTLRRAIDNVVRNAIRYTPVGGVVHVTSGETGNDGVAFASVTVCDRGPGVPEEQLKDIFRPFYRVDPSRQSSTGGFGIGLAIADRAMHVHRGNIRAFNRAGGGLCVALTIPAASGA